MASHNANFKLWAVSWWQDSQDVLDKNSSPCYLYNVSNFTFFLLVFGRLGVTYTGVTLDSLARACLMLGSGNNIMSLGTPVSCRICVTCSWPVDVFLRFFNISRYTSLAIEPHLTSPSMTNSFLSLMHTRLVVLSMSQKRLAFRTKLFGRVSRTTSGVLSVFELVTVVSPHWGCSILRNRDCLDAKNLAFTSSGILSLFNILDISPCIEVSTLSFGVVILLEVLESIMSSFFILSIINQIVLRQIHRLKGWVLREILPPVLNAFFFFIRSLFLHQLSQTLSMSFDFFRLVLQWNIAVQHVQHAVTDTMNKFLSCNIHYMVSFVFTILYLFSK